MGATGERTLRGNPAVNATVVLFDIDGTLLSTGGTGRRALAKAFGEEHQRPDACDHFSFDGMTDLAIARVGLTAIDLEPTAALIDRLLSTYLRRLAAEIDATPAEDYRVLPGMHDAIETCHRHGFAVGLGTGNVELGARLKLRRVGLSDPFAFGGFGDDHEERPELIRIGADRGARQLGLQRSEVRVIVIGDTPRDVAAAQAIGAECVGVATGAYSVEQLLACGATWAFETLGALPFVDEAGP